MSRRKYKPIEMIENDKLFDQLSLEIKKSNYEAIFQYLENGGNPNLTRSNGWTLLMNAAWKGHVNIVQLLLDRGASVDSDPPLGEQSALWVAACCGRAKSVRLLLEYGANINITPFGVSLLDAMKRAQTPSESVNRLLVQAFENSKEKS
jgi:ankyrin repeat protein